MGLATKWSRCFALLGLSAIVIAALFAPGSASAQSESGDVAEQEVVEEVAQAIDDVTGQDDLATPLPAAQSDEFIASTEDATVVLGEDSSDGLELTHSSGVSITVDLPDVGQDAPANLDGATVVYAAEGELSAVAAQPTDDGGVRALVAILAPETTTEFAFPMSSETDPIVLSLSESGGVDVQTEGGYVLAGIDPPWAIDANGASVPTYYRVDGSSIVQIVEHQGFAYPVIADPRLYWSSQNAIYRGSNNLCIAKRWRCDKAVVTVTRVHSGWRSASCGTVGPQIGGVGAAFQSCSWDRKVTVSVVIYGTNGSKLRTSTWSPVTITEKTYGGCAGFFCWSAAQPKESAGGRGAKWTFDWW